MSNLADSTPSELRPEGRPEARPKPSTAGPTKRGVLPAQAPGEPLPPGASPVTGIIDERLVLMDFGKHEGKSVREVAALDPEFYTRLVAQKEAGVYAIRRHRDKSFRLYINPLAQFDQ